MPRSRTPRFLVLAGAAALLAVLAVVMAVGARHARPRLERDLSAALGRPVRIDGRVELGLLPLPHVGFGDGRVLDADGRTAFAVRRARLVIAWLPLLRGAIRVNRVELVEPRLVLDRRPGGRIGPDVRRESAALLQAMDGATMSVSDGSFLYSDSATGARIEATGIAVTLGRLRAPEGGSDSTWMGSQVSAELRCARVRSRTFDVSDLRASVQGRDGRFDVAPIALELFRGRARGGLLVDLTGPVPDYRLHCTVSQFRIEQFLSLLSPDSIASGAMDFSARLSMRGGNHDQLVRSTSGTLSLRGSGLTLTSNDLDRAISRFEAGHNFSLIDVGGLFLAGPFSLVVTRGYNFAGLLRGSGGTSRVKTLVSDWTVQGGVAQATDVALATQKSRIALKGRLDFVHERFDDVIIAAVDRNGRVRVRQVVRGSFQAPEVEKPTAIGTLAGPLFDVLGRIRNALPGTHAETFYSGSVPAPD